MRSIIQCAGIPMHNAAQAEYDRLAALRISAGPSNPQHGYVCAGRAKVQCNKLNWAGRKSFPGRWVPLLPENPEQAAGLRRRLRLGLLLELRLRRRRTLRLLW